MQVQVQFGQPQIMVQQVSFSPYAAGFQPTNPVAFQLFLQVDSNRSGSIDIRELHSALSAGGYAQFSLRTSKLLMGMYDANKSGTLGFLEWEALLGQLGAWRAWFTHADADRSGKLSFQELSGGLRNFGYALSHPTLTGIFQAFDADCSGSVSFDE